MTEAEGPPLSWIWYPSKGKSTGKCPASKPWAGYPPGSFCHCSEHLNSKAKHDGLEPGPESPYHTAQADAKGAFLEHSLRPRVQTSCTGYAGMLVPRAQETT